MSKINEIKTKLEKYGLHIQDYSNGNETEFWLEDDKGNGYAHYWQAGKDFDFDCDHAYWEHGDDDEQGKCPLCGAYCDWHWEKDVDDNYPESIKEIESAEPTHWYLPSKPYGLLGEIVEALKDGETL